MTLSVTVVDPAQLALTAAGLAVATLTTSSPAAARADVILTGGRAGADVTGALADAVVAGTLDARRLHLWFGDERYLPAGDPQRNDSAVAAALERMLAAGLASQAVHRVPGPDRSANAESAATAYAADLMSAELSGAIAFVSIGDDGHIASLFPEAPALLDTGDVVAVHGAAKPPPLRVTMTLGTFARVRTLVVLARGAAKAQVVGAALSGAGPRQIPAAGIRGASQTIWLVDTDAARALPAGLARTSL
jgi:6-phosphogluconolactonase